MIGHGTTITFSLATGYFAEIVSVERSGVARGVIPTSHFATTGGQTFVPEGNYDPGELSIEVHRDPTNVVPMVTGIGTVTLTFPTGAPAETEVFSGFVIDHGYVMRDNEKVTETIRIKASGDVSWSP